MTKVVYRGLLTLALPVLLFVVVAVTARAEMLMIDFNSLTQDLGPHPEAGYQVYDAGHEVAADFDTKNYSAFGTTISLTPTWPDTTDNRVQQMIDRTTSGPPATGFDANYIGTKLDLITDFIGIDARPANGGNGPDVPTTMDLTLEGLPAGQYYYRAYHHDTEFVNAPFTITLTDADGTVPIGSFEMTATSPRFTNPNPVNPGPGNDPAVLPSTVIFPFRSDGSPVVIQYQVTQGPNVHESILGVNGIEISDQQIFPAMPLLEIDRGTGAMTFTNDTSGDVTMLGYSIRSAAGALDPAKWTPIAGNYDAPPSGDGSVDPDDPWTRLTAASSRSDLSEAELAGGNGATLASGQSIVLSQPGAGPWIQNPTEDVRMEFLQADGAIQDFVRVRFVGNAGQSLVAGDFNFDGVIDTSDYPIFLAGLQADLSNMSLAEAYQMGDMNADLANDHADILLFKAAFDGANGAGAFDAMITAVPEPGSLVLLLLGGVALLCFGRRPLVPARATAGGQHGNDRRYLDLRMAQRRLAARSSHWAIALGIALLGSLLLAGSVSAALITYVDAIGSNDPLSRTANTTLVDGSPFLPTEDDAADDQWRIRRFANPADPNGGTIFSSNEAGAEDAPGLVTTVSGLAPNSNYDMFAYLWSDPANWRLKASVTQAPPLPDDPAVAFSKNGTATSTQAPLAVAEDFAIVPMLAEGNRLMYQASLGTMLANDAGEILVYIDDQVGGGDRTWYDGVGYRDQLDPLTLEVNTDTGMTQILNNSGTSFDINFYEILSPSASLDVAGWDSLDDQKIDASGDGGPLDGWDEAGGSRAEVLSELNFLGSSVLADQGSFDLGSAFQQGTGQEDLEFNLGLSDGSLLPGIVKYVEGGGFPLGDVNLDTQVNGLDVDPFVDVLLNGPFQVEADMNLDGVVNGLDVDPFVAAVVGGGVQAVPEPSTLALLSLAVLFGLLVRRTD